MKSRPILFNGEMIRAILEGRKTQTRRPVKPQFSHDVTEIHEQPALDRVLRCVVSGHSGIWEDGHGLDEVRRCPFGTVGDRLWVRETWRVDGINGRDALKMGNCETTQDNLWHRADNEDEDAKWMPSILMPRWASRITLEITAVRVERVQEISEEDAEAEGVEEYLGKPQIECDGQVLHYPDASYVKPFSELWNAAYPGSWERNDWVWVIEFKRVEAQP